MNIESINTINKKLEQLSDKFTDEIFSYLEYLNFKNSEKDWYEKLNTEELNQIKKGEADYKSGNVFSNEKAREMIQDYIASKSK